MTGAVRPINHVADDLRPGWQIGEARSILFGSWAIERAGNRMKVYESPQIDVLGTIEQFTRGEQFAWQLDGMSLSDALHHIIDGGELGEVIGTS